MLAKIHIARKQLALAEDEYRAILNRLLKIESAALASEKQLDLILGEFKRLGWKGASTSPTRFGAGDLRQKKAMALWLSLFKAGAVKDASSAALSTYIKRQTGQDLGALEARQWNAVINGLRAWLKRVEAAHV